MSRSSLSRLALVAALATMLPAFSACSSDSAPAVDTSTADVVREGNVTDGQLRAVLDNAAQDWAWAGGQFDAPSNKDVMASDTAFEFAWHADPTEPSDGGAPGDMDMVHLLVFSTPSEPNLLRVFSTLGSYTPDAAAWQKLIDAGTSSAITLSLTSATFSGDELTAEGGPFVGQELSFTIE
jgi:hypothetical protein